jgi:hypothetical protein
MKATPLLLLASLVCASLAFAQQAPPQPSTPPAWRQAQRQDAAGTYSFTRFTLAGRFLSAPRDALGNRPSLVLDCIPTGRSHHKGRFLAANLLIGTNPKVVYVEPDEIRGTSYYAKVAVQYRTDTKDEQREEWLLGTTDKTAAAVPRNSLEGILRAHTLAITADDEAGSQIEMQFDIPDPTSVEQACHIDEH